MHIIPRREGRFKNNDDIYPLLESFDEDFNNKISTRDDAKLTKEAAAYREQLSKLIPDDKFIIGH